MDFTIYPAIDIRNGNCVRLYQGDYNQESVYFTDPTIAAIKWFDAGSKWLHIVDLDGALTGRPENIAVVKKILKHVNMKIQIGGGIRSLETAKSYLDSGVQRIIIGSAALNNRALIKELLLEYGPERIIVSLDGKNSKVFSEGWLSEAKTSLLDAATELADLGIETFIYTDIAKDGTLSGPNIAGTLKLAARTKKDIIVAGGVSSEQDIHELLKCRKYGITGAIVGKALYTEKINLSSLISLIKEAKNC